jgi:hypothetical protein
MRFLYVIIAASFFIQGCGGRTINNNTAKDLLVGFPQGALQKDDVEIVNVRQFGGSEAIAETRLKTAFRFQKIDGKWIIREVRLGHGQWEDVENLMQTLNEVKTEETKKLLDRIAQAIQKYQESTGHLPAFDNYVALSDALSPEFLTPLIRLDAWRHPLEAQSLNSDSILIWSPGPDGKSNTSDDIRKIFP